MFINKVFAVLFLINEIFGSRTDDLNLTASWSPDKWERIEALKKPLILEDPDFPPPFLPVGYGVNATSTKTFLHESHRYWPNGEVPYEIDPGFTSDERITILAAMAHVEMHTCITYRQRTGNDFDYVYVTPDAGGCYVQGLGYFQGDGFHGVYLSQGGCVNFGTVVHELLHSLGQFHEQTHIDRNDHIQVMWQNMDPDWWSQFYKTIRPGTSPRPPSCWDVRNNVPPYSLLDDCYIGFSDSFDVTYDYYSVMHYRKYSTSNNGEPVMIPKPDASIETGGNVMTNKDAEKVNFAYGCFNSPCGGNILAESPNQQGTEDHA